MSFAYNFFKGIAESIPVIVRKIGAVMLFFFSLGMLFGYFVVANVSPIILLFPFIAMVVMWYDLDQGVLVFILLMLVALWFPEILSGF